MNPKINPQQQPQQQPEEQTDDQIKTNISEEETPNPSKTKPSTVQPSFIDFVTKQKKEKPTISVTPPSEATEDQVKSVFNRIAKDALGIENPTTDDQMHIKIGVCELLQAGAASPKFDKNRKTNISKFTFNTKALQEAVSKTDGQLTMRKVARHLKKEIQYVAETWGLPGNLSKRYLLDNPDASIQEQIWASDFHTFTSDEDIPEKVKNWLIKNYNDRWNKGQK